jgi:hypothetical protein
VTTETAARDMAPSLSTSTSTYTLRSDGIVEQRVVAKGTQTLDMARENVAAFQRLAAGVARPLLVDMRINFATGPGVREYYASKEALEGCAAMAMLVASSTSRMIGNFFLTMNAPAVPCRMFTDEKEAVGWLRKLTR